MIRCVAKHNRQHATRAAVGTRSSAATRVSQFISQRAMASAASVPPVARMALNNELCHQVPNDRAIRDSRVEVDNERLSDHALLNSRCQTTS